MEQDGVLERLEAATAETVVCKSRVAITKDIIPPLSPHMCAASSHLKYGSNSDRVASKPNCPRSWRRILAHIAIRSVLRLRRVRSASAIKTSWRLAHLRDAKTFRHRTAFSYCYELQPDLRWESVANMQALADLPVRPGSSIALIRRTLDAAND